MTIVTPSRNSHNGYRTLVNPLIVKDKKIIIKLHEAVITLVLQIGCKRKELEKMNPFMSEHISIVHLPIQQLRVSSSFKEMAKANGFITLQDIFETSLHDLPFRPLSGYRMLKELIDVVDEYKLPLNQDFGFGDFKE